MTSGGALQHGAEKESTGDIRIQHCGSSMWDAMDPATAGAEGTTRTVAAGPL